MLAVWRWCFPLLVLATSIISTIYAQPSTIAAWGDSRLLGFTDVGAPVVWEPRIFNRAFGGERLDQILHLSSNDHGTIAYAVGGIFGWGGFSAGYKHAKYFIMNNEPDWFQDPIKELVGAGSFWMAVTQSGKVYSWTVFTSENGCKSPYQVLGTLTDQTGCYQNLGNIMPLEFGTAEPIIQVGCHATYCVAITQSKIFYWGTDPTDSFTDIFFPPNTPAPYDVQAATPSGYDFTHVAVARHGSLSEWFVVVGKNSTHPSVLFVSGMAAGPEDDRFLIPEPTASTRYNFLLNAPEAALPQDFATSWIALGLDHGVIASTNRIFVWGSNKYSQLGLNSISSSYIPLELTSSFPVGTVFAGLSVNNMTSYVLTASGEIYVFGPTRNCDDTRQLCTEENSAFYGTTEIRRTTEKIGPTLIPLPITAIAPPTFSHIPSYVDGRGVLPFYGTAFHVLGVVKDDVDQEPYRPLPSEAILGWGGHHQAPIDGSGEMPYGIDIGNFTTSAQLLSVQKPTLVGLPTDTRSISMLSTLWHSASALVDVNGTVVPYIWGSMMHNQTFSTPNMSESTNYVSYPPTTYSHPVNMTSKLDVINSGHSSLLKFRWANDGLIGQYANSIVSYSRFDVPDAWIQASPSTAIDDEISCSTRACGILQKSTGNLAVWSMDTEPIDDGFQFCSQIGLNVACPTSPQVLTGLAPVLKFSLASTMSVVVLNQALNSIQTSGFYGSAELPVLGTTSIEHTTFTPINFTYLGQQFPGTAVVSLSVGYQYSMFIVDFGGRKWMFGFGANNHGQIVGRNFASGLLPTRLPADWVDGEPTYIACVRETTFLLTVQGSVQKVFVWGYNGFGHMYGFGGIYHSKSSRQPPVFQLPEYLGTKYVIKSFTQGDSASTVFAHLTTSDTLTPYREPDQRPERLMAIGSDVLSDDFIYDFPRMLPQYYSAPTFGTELGRGEIKASENISKTSVGRYTTWHLTDANRLYGSGRAVCLPTIDSNAAIGPTTMLWEPALFLDMSTSSETILDIAAHDTSVIFILSNRTAGFLIPSDPRCPIGEILGDVSTYSSSRPYLMSGTYDKISCLSQTCCFLNNQTGGFDCFGRDPVPNFGPVKRDSESTVFLSTPTISFTGYAIEDIWVVLASVVFRMGDGSWHRYRGVNGVFPITGLEGRTVRQVASGYTHTLVLTDIGMFSLRHDLSILMSYANWSVGDQQFGAYLQYVAHTSVSQVAVWGHRSIWVNGTDIWYAGLQLWGFTVSGTLRDQSMPQVNVANRIVLPEGAELDKLITRTTDSDRQGTTNHIIMVRLKPKASPLSPPIDASPLAISPTDPPIDNDLSCMSTAPFPDCTCVDQVWRCAGSYVLDGSSAPITINNQVVIEGDLTVSGQGVLIIDIGNENSMNGKPYIRASGCIALLQPVDIELKKESVTSVPSGKSGQQVNLMESSCYQPNSHFVNVKQTEKKCRKISNQPTENKDNDGRVSLSVIFRVQSDSCNHWWIILVSFFGTAIVVVSVIVVIFVKSGTVQLIIQPYRGTNT